MKKELATQMNAYLANIGVSYIKLHNLHWNVVGSQFKAAHEYLETLYAVSYTHLRYTIFYCGISLIYYHQIKAHSIVIILW